MVWPPCLAGAWQGDLLLAGYLQRWCEDLAPSKQAWGFQQKYIRQRGKPITKQQKQGSCNLINNTSLLEYKFSRIKRSGSFAIFRLTMQSNRRTSSNNSKTAHRDGAAGHSILSRVVYLKAPRLTYDLIASKQIFGCGHKHSNTVRGVVGPGRP